MRASAAGKIDARRMITHRFSLNDINEAFEAAAAKEETGVSFIALEN